jgi:hypothetical protein
MVSARKRATVNWKAGVMTQYMALAKVTSLRTKLEKSGKNRGSELVGLARNNRAILTQIAQWLVYSFPLQQLLLAHFFDISSPLPTVPSTPPKKNFF